jgi:hypothetical protein
LLEAEKGRIPTFLRWRADKWDDEACKRITPPEDETQRLPNIPYAPRHKAYEEGNLAYAKRQAAILRKLTNGFEDQWKDVDSFIEMGRTALGILPEDETTEVEEEAADKEEKEWNEDGPHVDEDPVPPRPVAPPRPVQAGGREVGDEEEAED